MTQKLLFPDPELWLSEPEEPSHFTKAISEFILRTHPNHYKQLEDLALEVDGIPFEERLGHGKHNGTYPNSFT